MFTELFSFHPGHIDCIYKTPFWPMQYENLEMNLHMVPNNISMWFCILIQNLSACQLQLFLLARYNRFTWDLQVFRKSGTCRWKKPDFLNDFIEHRPYCLPVSVVKSARNEPYDFKPLTFGICFLWQLTYSVHMNSHKIFCFDLNWSSESSHLLSASTWVSAVALLLIESLQTSSVSAYG